MSAPCATQCLLNFMARDQSYQFGSIACYFEAYFHVSAIIVQFMSIMAIAWSSYQSVINNKSLAIGTATIYLIIIWLIAMVGVALSGLYSQALVMPNGAYCFFDFTSPTIVYFFSPVMILTLIATIYFYVQIYRIANITDTIIRINGRATDEFKKARRVAMRSMIFVILYFVGWFPAVIACFYKVIHGYLPEGLDVALAIAGSLNSLWQALAYGIFNRNLHKLIVYCIPSCGSKLGLEVASLRGRETVITINGSRVPAINSKELQIKRASLLPGQVDWRYAQESPTKLPDSLSPPKSPEKRSPSGHRHAQSAGENVRQPRWPIPKSPIINPRVSPKDSTSPLTLAGQN